MLLTTDQLPKFNIFIKINYLIILKKSDHKKYLSLRSIKYINITKHI